MRAGRLRGSVFVTAAPPQGMGIALYHQPDGRVQGEAVLTLAQQGPPGLAHGGVLAALLDEAMGAAAWMAGRPVVAAHLAFDYRRPSPLGVALAITGWVERVDGRKVHTRGEICLPDGVLAVEGRGLFLDAPDYFAAAGFELHSES